MKYRGRKQENKFNDLKAVNRNREEQLYIKGIEKQILPEQEIDRPTLKESESTIM